jgi:hypothetical protein
VKYTPKKQGLKSAEVLFSGKFMLPLFLMLYSGCVMDSPSISPVAEGPVVVRYVADPWRTFAINGLEQRIPQYDLQRALTAHQHDHPNRTYELVAEMKSTPGTGNEIILIFKSAGVSLRHFWVPEADLDLREQERAPGGHREGLGDLLATSIE